MVTEAWLGFVKIGRPDPIPSPSNRTKPLSAHSIFAFFKQSLHLIELEMLRWLPFPGLPASYESKLSSK